MGIKLRFTRVLKILSKWNKNFLLLSITDLKAFVRGNGYAFGVSLITENKIFLFPPFLE